MMVDADAKRWLRAIAGDGNVLDADIDLRLYEYDGGVDKHRPEVVVFPRSSDQVVKIVNLARERKIPFVGRGAGTGLSGGALADQSR